MRQNELGDVSKRLSGDALPTMRFTLRSLFVVTTFLAVVLGMIAWLDRAWIGK
jgi:hypothetical protein